MPGRTSWNSGCQSLRCSSQNVLPPVSTTPRHDPCRPQGCDVGWFGGIGAVVQLERVHCISTTYKKQKLVTSQLGWYDVPPTVTRRPWIWTYTSSTSATSVIWRSTATVSCVPSVTDYGNMLGCCTDMNGPVPEMSFTSILVACTIQHRPLYLTDISEKASLTRMGWYLKKFSRD
jgi:hypothetical protein